MESHGWIGTPVRRQRRFDPWRAPLLVALAALSVAAGFWFGGDTGRGVSGWAVATLAAAVLLGDLLGPPRARTLRLGSAAAMALLFAAGWYAGIVELERAFDGCVARGEEVRRALEAHRAEHGAYPQTLDGLIGVDLPGRRLIRPDLMRYAATEDGYRLEFADATARLSATEARGFFDRP